MLDSGVDPSAAGLQETTEGLPKVIEVRDCSGTGDVELVKVAAAKVIQTTSKFVNPECCLLWPRADMML